MKLSTHFPRNNMHAKSHKAGFNNYSVMFFFRLRKNRWALALASRRSCLSFWHYCSCRLYDLFITNILVSGHFIVLDGDLFWYQIYMHFLICCSELCQYSDVSLIRNPLNRKPRYPEMVFWLHISFANSEDPDQRAPVGALWSGAALFAILYITRNSPSKEEVSKLMYIFQK